MPGAALAQKKCVQNSVQPLSSEQQKLGKDLLDHAVCENGQKSMAGDPALIAAKALGSCVVEVIKGAFEFLVAQMKSLFELASMAVDLVKKFGSFIYGYLEASWYGTLPVFWAEQYLQGESFFSNLAKTIVGIPEMITKFFNKESQTFKCLSATEKVDYVCHAVGRVGPEAILMGMGIYTAGKSMGQLIYPKLVGITNAEKAAVLQRAINIKKTQEAQKISLVVQGYKYTKSKVQDPKVIALGNAKKAEVIARARKIEKIRIEKNLAISERGKNLSKTVKYNPRPQESYEFKKVGKLIQSQKDFDNLEDGAHIFYQDSRGNIITSKRYPLTSDKEILAGHEALKAELVAQVGADFGPAAAGEFFIDGGFLTEINNKSGRFFTGQQHLDFAVENFQNVGVKVGKEVRIRDYEKIEAEILAEAKLKGIDPNDSNEVRLLRKKRDPEHQAEKEIVEFIQENLVRNPDKMQEFRELQLAYRKIANDPNYRGKKPGSVDVHKMLEQAMTLEETNPKVADNVLRSLSYLNNVSNEIPRHFHGYFVLSRLPDAHRKAAIDIIKYMAEHGKLPD